MSFRTISWLKSEKLANIENRDIQPLIPAIYRLLGVNHLENFNKNTLDDILVMLEHRIVEMSNLPAPDKYKPMHLSSDEVLQQLARIFKSIPWAKDKDAWFLLDDYSPTVLPELAILAYNPVIFRLSSEVKIKVITQCIFKHYR